MLTYIASEAAASTIARITLFRPLTKSSLFLMGAALMARERCKAAPMEGGAPVRAMFTEKGWKINRRTLREPLVSQKKMLCIQIFAC